VTTVDVVVPAGIDDPVRPSGGNTYDRKVCDGLARVGWAVRLHQVPGAWPRPDAAATRALAHVVSGVPDGGLVLLDGLVASVAPEVLVPEARRVRQVVIVHLPVGAASPEATPPPATASGERQVLAGASAVVTPSAWARRWLLERYSLAPARVHVVQPGADRGEAATGSPDGGELLCVGAVARHKGHDLLLAALGGLRDRRWRCVLAGSLEIDPAFADGLRREAEASGLQDRLVFAGALDGPALDAAYDAADLLVLSSRMETYGMAATEALGRGLPVVAPAVGGIPEAVGAAPDGSRPALLVRPHDPTALATALRCWLDDADLRLRLRATARERRESLPSWTETTAEVSRVLVKAGR
jgi:glycosyltransferase involved in cell wall biosynthesis